MAQRISDLRTANKSGNTSREYVLLSNIDSNSSSKLALNDIFPTLQSGKTSGAVTEGTAGTTAQDIFVGGGVGSSTASADKSVLVFKGLNVEDTNGALKIRTDVSTSDANKKNIVIELTQSNIDLNVASNSTAKFLSESGGANVLTLSDSTHHTGTLPVRSGGTGATTLTDGGVLIGNGTSGVEAMASFAKGSLLVGTSVGTNPAALTVGTNDFVLTADQTAANGVKWAKPTLSSLTAGSDIDINGNNLKMGGGWINGSDLDNQGLYLDTSSDHVYIGDGTTYATSALNVEGNITLGNSTGTAAQTISTKACTSGATPTFTIQGGASDISLSGGALAIKGGAGDANGDGGDVFIEGGRKSGSGTEGTVVIKTADTVAVTVDESQDVELEGTLTLQSDEGVTVRGTTTVTQATSISTSVELSAVAGVITLYSEAFSAAEEQEFEFRNNKISSSSVIMLTVQQAASSTENDGSTLVAGLGGNPGSGTCQIRVTNPGSAVSSGIAKIHFLVINTAT